MYTKWINTKHEIYFISIHISYYKIKPDTLFCTDMFFRQNLCLNFISWHKPYWGFNTIWEQWDVKCSNLYSIIASKSLFGSHWYQITFFSVSSDEVVAMRMKIQKEYNPIYSNPSHPITLQAKRDITHALYEQLHQSVMNLQSVNVTHLFRVGSL